MSKTQKKERRRKLIRIETHVTGDGDGRKFGCISTLPLSSADAVESENAAARIMDAVNAQLDFAGSIYRLRMWDTKENRRVYVDYKE